MCYLLAYRQIPIKGVPAADASRRGIGACSRLVKLSKEGCQNGTGFDTLLYHKAVTMKSAELFETFM